jgi:formate dehydrogenase subunit gamma
MRLNAYRIGGALFALLFGALLVWVVWLTFAGLEDRVEPTGGVMGAAESDDLPVGEEAYQALANRTQLQSWRQTDHRFPGQGETEEVTGTSIRVGGTPRGEPGALVNRWMDPTAVDPQLVRERGFLEGTVAYPGDVNRVLQQPAGRVWRARHNQPVSLAGGWIVFGVGLLLAAFLFLHGRVVTKEPYEGRTVQRFSLFERANHWMTAIAFVLLALSGLVLLYGQYLIKPLTGAEFYGDFALWNVWAHMVLAVPFVLGVVVMLLLWTRQNLFGKLDWQWVKTGGFLGNPETAPPQPRFNPGQKLVFWGVVLGMLVLLATGVTLMFPFFWTGYDGMQLVQLVHAVAALLMIALIMGHIYIGTVGMERAIDAMWSGQVDRAWAHEHHRIWLERLDRGERPGYGGGHARPEGRGQPRPAE